MKYLEVKFKILDTVINSQVIDINYIPDNHFNALNIKDLLPDFKKSVYENVIFKKLTDLTVNKQLNSLSNIKFNIEQEVKKALYLNFKNDVDISQVKKPNMYVHFYENSTELFSYEINLPKKGFNFKNFDTNEFINEINIFINSIEKRIINNQIKTETEHYHFYNNSNATESFDKTLSRINRLSSDKRNFLVNKALKNKLNIKDKNEFYSLTKKVNLEEEVEDE